MNNPSEDKNGGDSAALVRDLRHGSWTAQVEEMLYKAADRIEELERKLSASRSSCTESKARHDALAHAERDIHDARNVWIYSRDAGAADKAKGLAQAEQIVRKLREQSAVPESGLTLEEADEANARWAQETSTPCPPVPAAPSTPQPEAPTPRTELDFLRHLSDLLCPPNGDMPQVKDALVELSARRMVLSAAQSASSATTPIIGYAVRMENNGAFVGIWRDREMAEHVCAKQPPGHNDVVIPVCEAPRSATTATEAKP